MMVGMLINTLLSAFSANPLLDPGWVGVGVGILAIVISVVIAIWSFRKGLQRKEISYNVITDYPVLRVGEEVKSKIKIEFDGQKVAGMSLIVLKVWNSGNKSVKPQDYIDLMTFKFEGRKVLDVSIQSMEPEDLIKSEDIKKYLEDNKPLPQNEKDTLQLPLMHLNSEKLTYQHESLTLRVLLSGSEGSISVEGRIDDGRIREFNPFQKVIPHFVWILILFVIIVVGFIGVLIIAPQQLYSITLFQLIIGILVLILFIRMLWGLITPYMCQCGYFTWSARKMLTHVEMGHKFQVKH